MAKEIAATETSTKWSGRLSLLRDSLSSIKELATIALFLAILVFLVEQRDTLSHLISEYASFLKSARVVKQSVLGIELARTDAQALESANKTLGTIKEDLSKLRQTTSDSGLKATLDGILKRFDAVSAATTTTQRTIQDRVNQQQKAIEGSTPGSTNEDTGPRVVVVSADKDRDPAEYELQQLKKLGLNGEIFERRGWLRTAVVAKDDDEADAIQTKLRTQRRNVYIENMSAWCPHREKDPTTGFSVCSGMTTD